MTTQEAILRTIRLCLGTVLCDENDPEGMLTEYAENIFPTLHDAIAAILDMRHDDAIRLATSALSAAGFGHKNENLVGRINAIEDEIERAPVT